MRYRLSRHAQEEVVRRRIPPEWIEAVLEDPEQQIHEAIGKIVQQSRFTDEHGKMYLVRAILATDKEPPVVITVYRTSKVQKYWRRP